MCRWAIVMLVFLISKNSKTRVCFHIFPCWLSLIVSKAAVRFQTPSACSFSDVRNAFRTKAFKARSLFHCEMICPRWSMIFGWLENLLILGSFWEDSCYEKPPKLRSDLGNGWFEIGHILLLPHPVSGKDFIWPLLTGRGSIKKTCIGLYRLGPASTLLMQVNRIPFIKMKILFWLSPLSHQIDTPRDLLKHLGNTTDEASATAPPKIWNEEIIYPTVFPQFWLRPPMNRFHSNKLEQIHDAPSHDRYLGRTKSIAGPTQSWYILHRRDWETETKIICPTEMVELCRSFFGGTRFGDIYVYKLHNCI